MSFRLLKKKITLFAILLVLSVIAVAGVFSGRLEVNRDPIRKIVDYDQRVLQQFLWFYAYGDASEEYLASLLHDGDPLRASTYLFRDFYSHRDVKKTEGLIDLIIDKWNLYETKKLNYTFPHDHLAAGWWSGMDSLQFPMFLVAFSQIERNEKYLRLANDMLDRMLKSPEEGGVLWRDESGCWLSEYSWNAMKPSDEYYVMNGNLFALEALKLTADALGRSDLEGAYQCVLNGTKNRAKKFLKPGDSWALYMLNPATINQVHYVIYEAMQFANLYELTGDIFYKEEADLRRSILRERYPIYSVGSGDDKRIFFSMMGAPHPYSLDTYGIRIACTSPGRDEQVFKQFHRYDEKKPFSERIFIDEKMDFQDKTSCSVMASSEGMEFLLYETSDFIAVKNHQGPRTLNHEVSASMDAYMNGDKDVIIDPARNSSETHDYLNTQARINYQIDPVSLTENSLLGFELTSDRDLLIGVQLNDGSKSIFRYYPKLKSGKKNLVLLSKIGFDNGGSLNDLKGATIFVYTHDQKEIASVRLGDVLLFDNQSSLKPYFKSSDVYMYTE